MFTDAATPAKRIKLRGLVVAGAGAGQGFNNFAKFDDGCDGGEVTGCDVSSLIGTASGNGYGVLAGNASGVKVQGNRFTGSAAGGRHAVYFSGGCSDSNAIGNIVEGFRFDAITQWSQLGQAPCMRNVYAYNVLKSCALSGNVNNGALSIMGRSYGAKLIGNQIVASGANGIKLEGTGVVDLLETEMIGNVIDAPGMFGIDIIAAVGGQVIGGVIRNASQAAAGTYSGIRFKSDAVTAAQNFLVSKVRIPASAQARSGVLTDITAPVPVGLKFAANDIRAGQVLDYEFSGLVFTLDGMRRASVAFNWPAIANGASFTQAFTLAALADMPQGSNIEATYTGNTDGMIFEVQCLVDGVARVTLANFSGAPKTATGGSVVLTWTGAK